MKLQGKVIAVERCSSGITVSCDCDWHDSQGALIKKLSASFDVPTEDGRAYFVGRKVEIIVTPKN